MPPADKRCHTCGRRIAWRAKWANQWAAITRCSAACRSKRPGPLDRELERAVLAMARARGAHKTLCPSDAARAVRPDDWRPLLERTRQAARRLVARGALDVLQGGRVVDASTARGPIRLRLARRPPLDGWLPPEEGSGAP